MARSANSATHLKIADLTVYPGQRRVLRGEEELPLGKLTFDVLVALAEAAPDVVTQDDLAERVWTGRIVSPDTIAQRIKILRQALGDDAQDPRYIRVLRGQGYELIPPVEPVADSDPVAAAPTARSEPDPATGVGAADSAPAERARAAGADESVARHASAHGSDPVSRSRSALAGAVAAGCAIALAAGVLGWTLARLAGPASEPSRPTRFEIALPGTNSTSRVIANNGVSVSADGRNIVYVGWNGTTGQLYRRTLGNLGARPVEGTRGATWAGISPDGDWIAFYGTNRSVRKVPIEGGPVVTLARIEESGIVAETGLGLGLWATNETLLWSGLSKLERVPAAGGEPTTIAIESSEAYWYVPGDVLPDGRSVLVTRAPWPSVRARESEIAVVSLATGQVETLVREARNPRYAASGHLVFWRGGSLWAAPFDASSAAVTGDAVPVVAGLELPITATFPSFDVSQDGSLVYLSASPSAERRELVWVHGDGSEERLPVPAQPYGIPRVSPVDDRVVVQVENERFDLWLYDRTLQPLTSASGEERDPAWSRDGRRIAYYATGQPGGPGVFVRAADGTGEAERLTTGRTQFPQSWSPDGRSLVLYDAPSLDTHVVALDGDEEPQRLDRTPAVNENTARIAPDGRWLAFESDATGAAEIWIQAFPSAERRHRISTAGGRKPVWSRDGRTLYFLTTGTLEPVRLMAVAVNDGAPDTWSAPQRVMPWPYFTRGGPTDYDVGPEGRFLAMKPVAGTASARPRLVFVQNWLEELERRVPVN